MFLRFKSFVHLSKNLIHNQLTDIVTLDRHRGLHLNLNKCDVEISLETLHKFLTDTLKDYKPVSCVWVHIPMKLGHLLPFLNDEGFKFHHAEEQSCSIVKWMKDSQSKIPTFCTHHVGISAAVCREKEKLVLLVKEKNSPYTKWKLPTGLANLGENIGDAAVREVFEETGIRAKYISMMSFWQRHNFPSSFGRSDLLALCRLTVVDGSNVEFTPCPEEIEECSWMSPKSFLNSTEKIESHFFRKAMRLIDHCLDTGQWASHEMTYRPIPSLHSRELYNFYLTESSWKVI